MTLGEKIRKIRILRDLKQETIAEKLGITPQAYSKLEREDTKMDKERLNQIASILGVTVEGLEKFDDKHLLINLNDCENSQGSYFIINNYSESDKLLSLFEQIIAQQKEQISQQKEEILFLRVQITNLLNTVKK